MRIARSPRSLGFALLATAGLVVSLAACSAPAPDNADAGDCAATPSGTASESVKVTGDFGKLPVVIFDPGISAKSTERSVVIDGDGDVVQPGDTVQVQFSILNGATAVNIDGTGYTDDTLVDFDVDENKLLPGLVKTLECSTVGSRVVGVIPPADAFGDAGSEQLGIGAGDDIVFVADVVSIKPAPEPALPKADGADQPPVDGFPTVVLDASTGRPTVTIPDTAPPTDFQLAVLKKGDGAVVGDGDSVTVQYEGITWSTKKIFDESWARGEPSTFKTSEVIPGFTQALVGQTVGSQVIAIIPPDLGYGPSGGRAPDISATDTIVFVVDILGIG